MRVRDIGDNTNHSTVGRVLFEMEGLLVGARRVMRVSLRRSEDTASGALEERTDTIRLEELRHTSRLEVDAHGSHQPSTRFNAIT
jgi:hypothetical protein